MASNKVMTNLPATPTTPFPPLYLDVDALTNTEHRLPAQHGLSEVRHHFDAESLHAINAALAAERPLLVRGEPGTGKSQLARAAALLLQRAFVWRVVDAQTQVSDLFYSFDAIERLAQAQVMRAQDGSDGSVTGQLHERNFVRPGPLWWAFNVVDAEKQSERYKSHCGADTDTEIRMDQSRGHVVLIDEIDKTDSSVPNGLLEALGQGTFAVPRGQVRRSEAGPAPLVVITTNEERELPSAFVRRCMVLHISVPNSRETLVKWLVERGQTHFRGELGEVLLTEAADMVYKDREAARERGLSPPGQAEYLDLLRALTRLRHTDPERRALLLTLRDFALKKHIEQHEPTGKPR
jgi:MoxR-like ATPase